MAYGWNLMYLEFTKYDEMNISFLTCSKICKQQNDYEYDL